MSPVRQRRRFWRVAAMVVTAVTGLFAGWLLAGGMARATADPGESLTTDLLRDLRRQDTAARRAYRGLARKLPATWQARFQFARPLHPDVLKPSILFQLGLRTNESPVIVPVLVEQLNRLAQHEFLTGNYVAALAAHGANASNALPWLQQVALNPTNLFGTVAGSPMGHRVTLADVHAALASISGHPAKYFDVLTNQLQEWYLPSGARDGDSAAAAAIEAPPQFAFQLAPTLSLAAGYRDIGLDARVTVLRSLLASPSSHVRVAAWHHLVRLAPGLPEVGAIAVRLLEEPPPGAVFDLQPFLAVVRHHPALSAALEARLQLALADADEYRYWALVGQVTKADAGFERLADDIAGSYFPRRIANFPVQDSLGLNPHYRFSPALERYLRASGADLTGLRRQLQAAAVDTGNPYRFDDAQVATRLGDDPELERRLLDRALQSSPPDARKLGVARYPKLVAGPGQAVTFLEQYLSDPDPQVRRVALAEMADLGTAVEPLLARIDEAHAADPSRIVRWQARRTANILRGLDPNDGIREPRRRTRVDP